MSSERTLLPDEEKRLCEILGEDDVGALLGFLGQVSGSGGPIDLGCVNPLAQRPCIVGPGDRTCLMYAAALGAVECARALIQAGSDVNDKDDDGETAVFYAVSHNQVAMVELLLDAGADVNEKGSTGRTALMYSVRAGASECTAILIRAGADLNSQSHDGMTPLMHAAHSNALDCMESLIQAGANVNVRDIDGETAIFYAMGNNNPDAVDLLIRFGAGVNERSYLGRTPLMYAAAMQNIAMVEHLLCRGGSVKSRDKDGYSALAYAVRGSAGTNIEILRALILNGADPREQYERGCVFAVPSSNPYSALPVEIVPLSMVMCAIGRQDLSTIFYNTQTIVPGSPTYNSIFS